MRILLTQNDKSSRGAALKLSITNIPTSNTTAATHNDMNELSVILPKRATYFSDIKDLIFDTNCDLRINLDHILNDEENFMRIPEQYRNGSNIKTLFNGAIEIAKKRIASNYNIAVPQFFEGYVQLLIPISLGEDISHTDLVLAVSRNNGVYLGKTCLTLDMAYNNARLIAKPEAPWINKQE